MTDVARLAGVSHQTVSRVLNAHPNVAETTRLRVQAAMNELGYRPNRAARALVTGASQTIGVVTQATPLFGPVRLRTALELAASEAGFDVSTASIRGVDRSSVEAAVERHLAQRVDGIVVIVPVVSAQEALDGVRGDVPVVAIDGDPSRPSGLVTVDQAEGARLATQHLLDAGHRTVWHVSGPPDWFDSAGRAAGWRETLDAAGREVPPVIAADWTPEAGYRAGQMLARMPEVTAVFAANDHLALGITKALRDQGLDVPDRISLVGFDDIPEAGFLSPPLTTVRPDFDAVAHQALQAILGWRDHGGAPAAEAVPPTLVQRDSVAAPR
ncbi:LacI family DNA-binding transcriptional regulator [Nocardioides mangrovicus]|uniref:LacI family DNA-binding transcriptional regulator n=2 Tax=Nocardioides mangrovicus TaxID=2478913 RepID=A0A3L8NYV7_9ACTN|nr:LacI family DNA-binding transcriptional regulator [Nocardioides mangrovicus]